MRNILLFFLCCNCLSILSQTTYDVIDTSVKNWCNQNMLVLVQNSRSPKNIDFPLKHYFIEGVFSKGVLCEGTVVRIYSTSSLEPMLLLEGRVTYKAGRLIINGIKYVNSSDGTVKIYGSFYVYNTDGYSMNYKPKKAGELVITNKNVSYLVGLYRQRPMIVSFIGDIPTVFLGAKMGGKGFTFLSAKIPELKIEDVDSFDSYQVLLQVKNDVTMCWEDGTMFEGSVHPAIRKDSIISFLPIEGRKTGMTIGAKTITVSRESGNIVYSQDFGENHHLLANETLLVKDDGSLSEDEYWDLARIYELCHLARWTYKDGNYFEGTIKTTATTDEATNTTSFASTAIKGVFKYPNGDRFEGNISSKTVGPFFIDGTTYFVDGSKVEGDWLEKYQLNNNQWDEVYNSLNPSEAKALAVNFTNKNFYIEYRYYGNIEYFDPIEEKRKIVWGGYIQYDKMKKQYTCKYKRDSKDTLLVFAVDDNGYRTWERVFEDGTPTYVNQFTWYSNGAVESIKSYSYDTREIFLSCNFFSDGELRSAYQYGRGNTGKNILRKSKESHPTSGGYTSKLYDLNGNYERSIDWEIGIGESLFGGRFVQKMAPTPLVFGDLKLVE